MFLAVVKVLEEDPNVPEEVHLMGFLRSFRRFHGYFRRTLVCLDRL